jgi:hypothetical protein
MASALRIKSFLSQFGAWTLEILWMLDFGISVPLPFRLDELSRSAKLRGVLDVCE